VTVRSLRAVPAGLAVALLVGAGAVAVWLGSAPALAAEPTARQAGPKSLYPRNDRWRAWLAGEARCPGGEDAAAPARAQVKTMLCLVNYARRKQRLRPLVLSAALSSASSAKARDIARCGVFEHDPCGKAPDRGARAVGYEGMWGENLFFATGSFVVPRVALDRWLNSPGHRRNVFRRGWRTIGIARRAHANVGRVRNAVIWVNQFGDGSASAAGALR
jgi:uncharacterized protein YkwD